MTSSCTGPTRPRRGIGATPESRADCVDADGSRSRGRPSSTSATCHITQSSGWTGTSRSRGSCGPTSAVTRRRRSWGGPPRPSPRRRLAEPSRSYARSARWRLHPLPQEPPLRHQVPNGRWPIATCRRLAPILRVRSTPRASRPSTWHGASGSAVLRGRQASSPRHLSSRQVSCIVQDMESNVFALDLESGSLRWSHRFYDTNPGPNGVVVSGGRVYGATDTSAFALSARTGRLLWSHLLVTANERYVDVAPQVAGDTVYVSTIGLPPNGHGALYGLQATTGSLRWRLSTIKGRWRVPSEAGGGGAWYPPSVAGGTAYWGTANPYPYGGTSRYPNGGAFAGPALYTDSLVAVHREREARLVRPGDSARRARPRLPAVARPATLPRSTARSGRRQGRNRDRVGPRDAIARLWQTKVGVHRHDSGPLPAHRTTVCPGLLGGVETPMAYAAGMLFVPVVDLCMRGSAVGYEELAKVDVARRGRGELVALDAATGRVRLGPPATACDRSAARRSPGASSSPPR